MQSSSVFCSFSLDQASCPSTVLHRCLVSFSLFACFATVSCAFLSRSGARYEAAPWVLWSSTWRLTPSPSTSSSWWPAMSSSSSSSSSPASCTTAVAKTPPRSTPPTARRHRRASRPYALSSCRIRRPRAAASPTTRRDTRSHRRRTWAGRERNGRGRRGVPWSEDEEERAQGGGDDHQLLLYHFVLWVFDLELLVFLCQSCWRGGCCWPAEESADGKQLEKVCLNQRRSWIFPDLF